MCCECEIDDIDIFCVVECVFWFDLCVVCDMNVDEMIVDGDVNGVDVCVFDEVMVMDDDYVSV